MRNKKEKDLKDQQDREAMLRIRNRKIKADLEEGLRVSKQNFNSKKAMEIDQFKKSEQVNLSLHF